MAAAADIAKAAALSPHGKPEDRLGLDLDDVGNAERLKKAYGRDLMYITGRGWAAWMGTHWSFERGELRARRMAAKLKALVRAEANAQAAGTVDDVTAQRWMKERQALVGAARGNSKAAGLPYPQDLEHAKELLVAERAAALREFANKCGSKARITNALTLLEPELVEGIDVLDSDPWKLATPNGTLDLAAAIGEPPVGTPSAERRAALEAWDAAHEAEDIEERAARLAKCLGRPLREMGATRTLGVAFDPAAECPRFDAFLALIQPDPLVRGFLLRALSLVLLGRNDEQVAILLRGSGGNGKSTLVQVLMHVLGGYAVPARIAMFLHQDTEKPGAPSPEEMDLIGARAMIASEPKARDRLGSDRIKAFTGGDERTARALNQPPIRYTPRAVPILQFNRTPEIPDEDEGTWRRLVFIPFDVNLRELPAEQRRNPEDVLAELRAEGPGILNRLLEALGEVRRGGLQPPQRAVEMKTELRAASDPVGEFIKACCEVDERYRNAPGFRDPAHPIQSWVQSKTFADAFTAWCEANGFKPYAPQTVRKLVNEKGWHARTMKGRAHYQGLRVTVDMREEEPPADDPHPLDGAFN